MITGDYAQSLEVYKKGALIGGLIGGLGAVMFIKKNYVASILIGAIFGGYLNNKIHEKK